MKAAELYNTAGTLTH